MDGIIVGHSPTSNAILIHNPRNQRYYEPDSYKIDPYRLPSSVYPTIIYYGGLFVSLHHGDVLIISKPYPPGTRVEEPSLSNDTVLRSGTVMDIPLDPTTSPHYRISSCSTMVPPNPSLLGTCRRSFPNHHRHLPNQPRRIVFPRFFASTPRLHSIMKDDTTKGITPNRPTVSTTSATSLTSTRNNPIGAFLYQIFRQLGKTYAPRVSSLCPPC